MITDSAAIAAAVREAPAAPVACYDGWTLVELGGHVGQIHRWVAGIVQDRAQERPSGGHAEVPQVAGLPDWIVEGARRLVDTLAAADPDEVVWTIDANDRTVGFWRRRMALETAHHRWDAEDALGMDAVVDADVARAGIEETLRVYLEQRLDGKDVGGTGQRVAFEPLDGGNGGGSGAGWTMVLQPDGVAVEDGSDDPDATVRGSALDLWLLLTCRRGLDDVDVTGDRDAAERAVRAAWMVPGPAG